LIVTVLESPAAVPAVPENVGVGLFVELAFAGLVSVTVGPRPSRNEPIRVFHPVELDAE
jgi:hypothetical protein